MYKLKWKDEVIAVSKPNGIIPILEALPNVPQYRLPFDLFGFKKRQVSMMQFIEWASERCFPEERIGAEILLKELGLDRYDGWEIVKKTKAKLGQDYYSIDFDNDDTEQALTISPEIELRMSTRFQ